MTRVSTSHLRILGRTLAGVLMTQLVCLQAHAALGADVTSVENDRQRMKAELRVTTAPGGYTVHEIQTPATTVVREYVSPSGRVFAVAWSGPVLPDLQQTLGSYYEQYRTAGTTPHEARRHLRVDQPDLVIRSNGHMRAFHGYAYVPSLLPTNFSADDIK